MNPSTSGMACRVRRFRSFSGASRYAVTHWTLRKSVHTPSGYMGCQIHRMRECDLHLFKYPAHLVVYVEAVHRPNHRRFGCQVVLCRDTTPCCAPHCKVDLVLPKAHRTWLPPVHNSITFDPRQLVPLDRQDIWKGCAKVCRPRALRCYLYVNMLQF